MSDAYLTKLYYDPARGFQSIENLYRKAQEDGKKYTKKQVKEWLEKQEVVQTHQQNKEHRQFPIYSDHVGAYQADLFFYSKYMGRFNDSHNAFMSVKNITTRKAYVIPMKNKKWESIRDAWKTFMSQATIPCTQLTTDKGSEWISKEFRQYSIQPHSIVHRTCETADHSRMGSIESFHRTLKMKLTKYMASYKTKRFIDELPNIMKNYNDTVQERLKMSPNQIEASQSKQEDIRKEARIKTRDLSRQIDFPIGSSVRVRKTKTTFGKEKAVWSDTIHKVSGGSTFNTSFQVDGKPKRWKHYELKKVDEKAEKNPFKRKKADGFDLEEHMQKGIRENIRIKPKGQVEKADTRPVAADKAKMRKDRAEKESSALSKAQPFVGKTFQDGGKTWVISAATVDKSGKPFLRYYDKTRYRRPPATAKQERSSLAEIVKHAEWVSSVEGKKETAASTSTVSKLNPTNNVQPGRFVTIKNPGVNLTKRFAKLVTPDSPFFFIAKVKSIKGKEVSLQWWREDKQNEYRPKSGDWHEHVRSVAMIDPQPVVTKGVMSLPSDVWKSFHVVGHTKKVN